MPEEMSWPLVFTCLARLDQTDLMANGHPLLGESYLPLDSRNQARIKSGCQLYTITAPSESLIDDDHANTITAVVQSLARSMADGTSTVADWIEASPVMPGVSDRAEMLDEDNAIHDRLPALSNACLRPRNNLIADLLKVPVSRAKRIPQRAASHLAAHPEDWAQPTLSGPRPHRILSEVAEESLDIFENRFMARLIDQCDRYLLSRIRELRRLVLLYKDVLDIKELGDAHWARQNRVYKVLADLFDKDTQRQSAQRNLEKLTSLRYRILGLSDSELYKAIPRRAYISASIPNTNILNNDFRYRQARDLWYECFSSRLKQTSAEENQSVVREKFESFDLYAALLVIQSAQHCSTESSHTDVPVTWDTPIHFKHKVAGKFTITINRSARTIMVKQGRRQLQIIPLYLSMMALSEEEQETMHSYLAEALPEDSHETLFLYPDALIESDEDRDGIDHKLRFLRHELPDEIRARYSMLPISPWLIGSLDQIGRAISWFLLSHLYRNNPPEIELHRSSQSFLIENGHSVLRKSADPDLFEVISTSYPESLTKKVKSKKNSYDGAQGKRKKEELEDGESKIKDAISQFKKVLHCPICNEHDVQPKRCGEGLFWCECPECEAKWGTRRCNNCNEPKPIIHPHSSQWIKVLKSGKRPTLIAGSDLLCTPFLSQSEKVRFQCHACGLET